MDFTLGTMSFSVYNYAVDTSSMVFPISSFLDISFYNSRVTFEQPVEFQPGVTVYADESSALILSGTSTSRIGSFYAIDTPYDYWDNGTFVSTNNISTGYTRDFLNNQYFWKYFHSAKIDCYGSLLFDKDSSHSFNTSSNPYIVSGNANIAYIGYEGGETYGDLEEFFEIAINDGIYIQTYGLDYLGKFYYSSSNGYYYRASAAPLTSFMEAFVFDTTNGYSYTGTFDSETGIFTNDGDGLLYFFQSDRTSFSIAKSDRHTVNFTSCTLTADDLVIYANSTYYVFFAGIYCKITGTYAEGTTSYTINTARLWTTTTLTVKYTSTTAGASYWGR